MNKTERNIFFHINALKKVRVLSLKIISDLKEQNLDEALDKISLRDQLLKVIFELHGIIENQISELTQVDQSNLLFYKAWMSDVDNWSKDQSDLNSEIETYLILEKSKITSEIASIFDKKSRHKGYDLTNVK